MAMIITFIVVALLFFIVLGAFVYLWKNEAKARTQSINAVEDEIRALREMIVDVQHDKTGYEAGFEAGVRACADSIFQIDAGDGFGEIDELDQEAETDYGYVNDEESVSADIENHASESQVIHMGVSDRDMYIDAGVIETDSVDPLAWARESNADDSVADGFVEETEALNLAEETEASETAEQSEIAEPTEETDSITENINGASDNEDDTSLAQLLDQVAEAGEVDLFDIDNLIKSDSVKSVNLPDELDLYDSKIGYDVGRSGRKYTADELKMLILE